MKEVMMKQQFLPDTANAESLVSQLLDMVSKNKVSIQKMLDSDCLALSKDDMVYFDTKWWGLLPNYAQFMRALKKVSPEAERELRYAEAEALGAQYEEGMRAIFEKPTEDMDGYESKRFGWAEKLYKMQERKMDRIDKRSKEENVERGVDLAIKVIGAMSNAQLLKAKEVMEAEWKEVNDE